MRASSLDGSSQSYPLDNNSHLARELFAAATSFTISLQRQIKADEVNCCTNLKSWHSFVILLVGHHFEGRSFL
jgi:hypothetical protein